ncbi:MAG TPA: sulfite exporter TauE/SafE family protein [Bryobacteraceae bacterium]
MTRPAKSVLLIAFCAGSLVAHPMGNFSISHYAGLHIERDAIEVRYIIDMAEIPTFQELQQSGLTPRQDDPGLERYLTAKAGELAKGLGITLNGRALPLKPLTPPPLPAGLKNEALFSQGAGNLSTMKLGFVYRAELPGAERYELSYQDTNFAGRAGWKEIVISVSPEVHVADGVVLRHDRSSMLSNYPTDPLDNPPQDLSARFAFTVIAPPVRTSRTRPMVPPAPARAKPAPVEPVPSAAHGPAQSIDLQPNQQTTPRNAFTELMAGKEIGLGVMLIGALVAAGLGALHALEPGHGKTIVAAYLVGSKGTARHAFLLGLIVTASHTAAVYLLGGVSLYAQKYILPDRLYPFLSVMSGILIAGMGMYILLQRFSGIDVSHSHGPGGHTHGVLWGSRPEEKLEGRQLAALGITAGIVPCPAALVVLLSAVTLHRVGFGLFLIIAFSLGLAAVLIAMGLAAVSAGRLMSRLPADGPLIQRWLPVASAAIITTLGCVVVVRGLMAAGIVQIRI